MNKYLWLLLFIAFIVFDKEGNELKRIELGTVSYVSTDSIDKIVVKRSIEGTKVDVSADLTKEIEVIPK